MSVRSLGQLTLDLIAKIGGFTGPMDQAARHSQRRAREIQREMDKAGKAIAAGFAIASSAVAAWVKSSINAADQAMKTSQAVGLSVEAFTGLQWVAKQSGVETAALTSSITRLNASLGEAAAGSKTQMAVFKALGIEVKDAAGNMRAGDEVLKDLAERFEAMPDGIDKSNAAIKVFGKSGAAMIPMLNQGRDGIEKLTRQAEALGLVIGEDQARKAELFNDSLSVLGAVTRGIGNQLSRELLPTLNDFTGLLVDIAEDGATASFVADKIAAGMKWIAAAAVGAVGALDLVTKNIAGFVAVAAAAIKDVRWYDSPLKVARKLYANWEQVKRQAAIVEADIDETLFKYARIIDGIWDAGTDTGAGEKRIKELSDFLRNMRQEVEAGGDKTADAAAKAQRAIEDLIWSLNEQIDTFGESEKAATLYRMAMMEGVTPAQLKLAEALLDNIAHLKEQQALMDEGRRVFESVMTPAEKYAETVDRLNSLYDAGAISIDTYSRAVKQAADAIAAAAEDSTNDAEDAFKSLEQAIDGWGKSSARAIAEFSVSGKGSFADMAESIIKDIITMMIYQGMMKSAFGGMGGAFSGLFSGGGGGYDFQTGPAFNLPGRASGGPVRPYGAYVVGERGPEVLQMGSQGGYVHPSGGGQVVNNILIKGGNPELSEQQNATGGQDIVISLESAHASNVMSGRGPLFRAIRQVFGAQPALGGR